jgi:hypothetical protein
MEDLASLNDIFQTHSLYKTVLVVHDEIIDRVHAKLLEMDYPVSRIASLGKFVTSNDRVLLIDQIDAGHMDLVLQGSEHVFDEISAVIRLGPIELGRSLRAHPLFTL